MDYIKKQNRVSKIWKCQCKIFKSFLLPKENNLLKCGIELKILKKKNKNP